jgi:hypothetical protein
VIDWTSRAGKSRCTVVLVLPVSVGDRLGGAS